MWFGGRVRRHCKASQIPENQEKDTKEKGRRLVLRVPKKWWH